MTMSRHDRDVVSVVDIAPYMGCPVSNTLIETNIAPENWCLEDYFPFGKAHFQGLC